ncbi:hypothetical protein JOM56_005285 [Amanita muscaria]
MISEIKSTTSNSEATTPATYSAPTLMDLVNEENILPADINVERLEAEWFEQSDPYDLAETDRMTTPDDANIVRCSTRWNVGDAVKLDSRLLASLIKHLGGDRSVLIVGGHVVNASSSLDCERAILLPKSRLNLTVRRAGQVDYVIRFSRFSQCEKPVTWRAGAISHFSQPAKPFQPSTSFQTSLFIHEPLLHSVIHL